MGKAKRAEDLAMLVQEERLEEAWDRVRASGASPGVDGLSLRDFEADLAAQLSALRGDVLQGSYTPQAYRGVRIPKTSGGYRQIVIATVRDRVLQTAAVIAMQPLLDPLLHPSCFAYRRGKGVQDALLRACEYRNRGLVQVVRTDFERFFDTIPHQRLFDQLTVAGLEEGWLDLVRDWLKAPILDEPARKGKAMGLPQGLAISPLLANLYVTPFDRALADKGIEHIRYADDLLICCASSAAATHALSEAQHQARILELQLSEEKTAITAFDEGFTFLGATFRGQELIPAAPHPYEADFTPQVPLAPRPARPPLQGLPRLLMRTLYIQEQGSRLGRHGGRFVVMKDDDTLVDLPAHFVDQIFMFGRVHMSSPAITFCLQKGIHVHLFSNHGRYYGVLRPPDETGFELRAAQFALHGAAKPRLAFARAVVRGKLKNCLHLVQQQRRNRPGTDTQKYESEIKAILGRLDHAKRIDQVRGFEGSGTSAYFRALGYLLQGEMEFTRRTRNPPLDPVNSLLSFGYTLVLHNMYSYICARGLYPGVGILHSPGHGHPALASDLIEEFRAPIVDGLVLGLVNRRQVQKADFYFGDGEPQPCLMRDETRKLFIEAFEERLAQPVSHPDVDHPVDWRRVMDLQVGRFRRFVEGKLKAYTPYMVGAEE